MPEPLLSLQGMLNPGVVIKIFTLDFTKSLTSNVQNLPGNLHQYEFCNDDITNFFPNVNIIPCDWTPPEIGSIMNVPAGILIIARNQILDETISILGKIRGATLNIVTRYQADIGNSFSQTYYVNGVVKIDKKVVEIKASPSLGLVNLKEPGLRMLEVI